ncbi:MAG: hypothetical protein OQK73_03570 [Gammaproteobacteria bacterium]|nr:hypothetical protein [Gammaproteobacteria bacterium]
MAGKAPHSRNLLSIIQDMYSTVVCTILNNRMQRYCIRHGQKHTTDISSRLSEQIKALTEHHNNEKNEPQVNSSEPHAHNQKPGVTNANSGIDKGRTVNTKKANELSRYFKKRGNSATLNPGIEDTLTHSAWEHIHLSLRLARQGNTKSAKMHADIANHAYKELAHYMTEEKYSELTQEIEKELNQVSHS